jgi:hypothetical protein
MSSIGWKRVLWLIAALQCLRGIYSMVASLMAGEMGVMLFIGLLIYGIFGVVAGGGLFAEKSWGVLSSIGFNAVGSIASLVLGGTILKDLITHQTTWNSSGGWLLLYLPVPMVCFAILWRFRTLSSASQSVAN